MRGGCVITVWLSGGVMFSKILDIVGFHSGVVGFDDYSWVVG